MYRIAATMVDDMIRVGVLSVVYGLALQLKERFHPAQ